MFTLQELHETEQFIRTHFPPTSLISWPQLQQETGCDIWVKHENHLPTGAFKVRGGLVLLDELKKESNLKGVISATRGNHGQSLALAAKQVGIPLTIVVPEGNSKEKNQAMTAFGATLIEYGKDFDFARKKALVLSQELGLTFVPSFHPALVKGVATYAFELFNALDRIDTVYVPIGMGSGICGMIKTRDLLGLKTEIVGVVASGADAMAQSFEQNCIVTTEQAITIADGLACREPQQIAFDIIKKGATRIVRVSDQEVKHAINCYHKMTHNLAEGAGAASLAALIKEKAQQQSRRVAVILSGGNVDLDLYKTLIMETNSINLAEFTSHL